MPDLQYLAPNKKRESDADIRIMIILIKFNNQLSADTGQ